jgi:hypothetical protein
MKKYIALAVMLFSVFSLFATDKDNSEVEAILSGEADTVISGMTFGEVQDLLGRLSVPMQEAAFVNTSRTASMMMPGRGQFMNDDAASGALFLAADILVTAGTLVGGYFLLPPELQFNNLDYLNTSHTDLKAAWKGAAESATFMDALPTLGVIAGGTILHRLIAHFSAKHAGDLAKERIEKGLVTFEPITVFSGNGHGRFGLGMGMKF